MIELDLKIESDLPKVFCLENYPKAVESYLANGLLGKDPNLIRLFES